MEREDNKEDGYDMFRRIAEDVERVAGYARLRARYGRLPLGGSSWTAMTGGRYDMPTETHRSGPPTKRYGRLYGAAQEDRSNAPSTRDRDSTPAQPVKERRSRPYLSYDTPRQAFSHTSPKGRWDSPANERSSRPSFSNPSPPERRLNPEAKPFHPKEPSATLRLTPYGTLHRARETFHVDHLLNPFPKIQPSGCKKGKCLKGELLGCCHHDLQVVLQSSGEYSAAMLKKERNLWHPDKFSTKGDGPLMADEMFKMVQRLIEEF